MSKHTQQEWQRDGSTVYALNIEGTNRFVAQVQGGWATQGRNRTDAEEVEANARLIAAAPELLEACQTFAEWLRREDAGSDGQAWACKRGTPEGEAAWRDWWDENLRICNLAQEQARAAIAKATGER